MATRKRNFIKLKIWTNDGGTVATEGQLDRDVLFAINMLVICTGPGGDVPRKDAPLRAELEALIAAARAHRQQHEEKKIKARAAELRGEADPCKDCGRPFGAGKDCDHCGASR